MAADEAIEAARTRRKQLYEAILDVESALQAPAASPTWRATLEEELHDLVVALEAHTVTVEGPGGIIEEAVRAAPRLAGRSARLRQDHVEINGLLAVVDGLLDDAASPPSSNDVAAIRAEVGELLGALMRHRQRGSDFVWRAYDIDIGGG